MTYDESTAWFRVQHCLKPLRPLIKKAGVHTVFALFPQKLNSSSSLLSTLYYFDVHYCELYISNIV